jgi:hypothetical protein
MTDLIPDNRNQLAYAIGKLFHPYLICMPTLLVLLNDIPFQQMLGWLILVVAILVTPLVLTGRYLEQREQYIYQRKTRGPIYVTFWLSLMLCLAVIQRLEAPRALTASIVALAVWVPIQLLINRYVTKVSTHAAVIAACSTGLLLLGKLNNPILLLIVISAVVATLWARVVTRNHTIPQVAMGLLVGTLPILVVFSLML